MIQRRKPVTIVAGFRVQDGILLCSDTEWSGGAKVYKEKIFTHPFRGGVISFAVSGNEANAKMVIEDCQDALAQRGTAYTAEELKVIVRGAVRNIQEKYVDEVPKAEKADARFDLIIGLMLESGRLQLLATRGRSVLPANDFACHGLGWYVGHPIIESAYDPNMRIKDAVIVAIRAMAAAKRQIPGVGGHSQFLVIGEQFVSGLVGHDPAVTEELILEYEKAIGALLLRTGDFDLDDRTFKEKLLNFEQLVTDLRARWAAASAPYRELIAGLAKPASDG
jgi:20S proteasome alpha/beta subunit